jgi:hypothetical protein
MTDSMTDTQNSAGVPVGVERINDYIEKLEARITELEAHIAAEPDRMREVVERVKEAVRGDYTEAGMEDAFFRWSVTERAIFEAIRAQEIKP